MRITVGEDGEVLREGQTPNDDAPEGTAEITESGDVAGAPQPDSDAGETPAEPTQMPQHAPVVLTSGAITHGKTIEIKCVDCGAPRIIKPQDVFQVKRCPDCQKKYRNKARGEARKAKRAKEREEQAEKNADQTQTQ